MNSKIDILKKRAVAIGIGDVVDFYFKRVNAELENMPESKRALYLKESCDSLDEDLTSFEVCCRSLGQDRIPNPDGLKIETPEEIRSQVEVIVD